MEKTTHLFIFDNLIKKYLLSNFLLNKFRDNFRTSTIYDIFTRVFNQIMLNMYL